MRNLTRHGILIKHQSGRGSLLKPSPHDLQVPRTCEVSSPPLELSRNGDRVHVWRLDKSRTEKRKRLNTELRRQIDEDRKSTGDGIVLVEYDVMEHTDDDLRNNVFTPQPQAVTRVETGT